MFNKEYHKKYREEHKEEYNKYQKKYRSKNKEKLKEYRNIPTRNEVIPVLSTPTICIKVIDVKQIKLAKETGHLLHRYLSSVPCVIAIVASNHLVTLHPLCLQLGLLLYLVLWAMNLLA